MSVQFSVDNYYAGTDSFAITIDDKDPENVLVRATVPSIVLFSLAGKCGLPVDFIGRVFTLRMP